MRENTKWGALNADAVARKYVDTVESQRTQRTGMREILKWGMVVGMMALAMSADAVARKHVDTVTTASGLKYVITRHGNGEQARPGNIVIAHYVGTLLDGTVFDNSRDRNEPFAFTLGSGQVIKGWDEGFALLRVGDRATLVIPAELAYGSRAAGPIPPNSTLVFDVELLDLKEHSLADLLAQVEDSLGIEAAVKTYQGLKGKGAEYYIGESQLNALGYRYLQSNKIREAIAIFKINIDEFPESFNVYDSLGEAYMLDGKDDLAIANYRKSLALNPKNDNAAEMLRKLQSKGGQRDR